MLEATNVSARYGKHVILKDFSLRLNQNESIALIGNNGCGKTTFIKCVLGQLKHKGVIEKVNDICIIPQNDIFIDQLTVREHFISLGTYDNNILRTFGLESSSNLFPRSLSGGQRRRLTIALVLSLKPKILVLDEITVGSDYLTKL